MDGFRSTWFESAGDLHFKLDGGMYFVRRYMADEHVEGLLSQTIKRYREQEEWEARCVRQYLLCTEEKNYTFSDAVGHLP